MSLPLIDGWERASFAQQGMWITERTGAGGRAYAMPLTVRFDGPLDVDAMLAACAAVVGRHPVLAAVLAERDGEIRLLTGEAPPPIRFTDLSGPSGEAAHEAAIDQALEAEVARPFDLETGPPSRFTLFRLAPGRHLLQVVAHHAVFDGMSKEVLLRDLAAAHAGSAQAPLPISYGEAARAEQERVAAALEEAAEFWRPRWHDEQEVALPGPARPSLRAAPGDTLDLHLGDEVAAVAGPLGLTRFETVLAVLHTLLYGYGNTTVAVAVDLSTRTEETREHVGAFVNELPVVSRPAGTFAEFARSVREEVRAIYRFREVPLARALGGISPRAALTPVSLSYRGRSGADPSFDGLDASVDWSASNGAVRNTLHLQIVDGPDGMRAHLRFNPEAIGRAACECVAEDLRVLLEGVAARPGTPIDELPLPARVVRAVPAEAAGGTEAAGSVAVASPVAAPATQGADAGDAELVRVVTEIWCEALGTDEVGPEDDLFDLGGHSLTITQIIARVRDRLGVELSFEVFIDTPTVAGVVEEIGRSR
ncbi:condensation domain-containing protein [Streptosporangium sp. NPDC050855]|uniref:condensation domain-containing protein n=1 Tax=Streptosporangium sp. NPDC050855 TaxID=3366194 RepID=UPI0037AF8015